jgi:hypothetical protein
MSTCCSGAEHSHMMQEQMLFGAVYAQMLLYLVNAQMLFCSAHAHILFVLPIRR